MCIIYKCLFVGHHDSVVCSLLLPALSITMNVKELLGFNEFLSVLVNVPRVINLMMIK